MNNFISGSAEFNSEFRLSDKFDNIRHVKILASKDDNKLVIGHVQNITDLKKTEGELKELKLSVQEKQEKASRLILNMSHEIRTPLNGILGIVEMLLDRESDAKVKKHLKIISGSGKNLVGLINNILDYSKITAGGLELTPSYINLTEVLDALVGLYKTNARKAQCTLKLEVLQEPENISMLVDEIRFVQVVTNLLGNALKYTKNGHIKVKLKIVEQANDRASVSVSVSDDGSGIYEADQIRIFEPFEQVGANKIGNALGTGLGLNISRKIVELMGGSLEVESSIGNGSRFEFNFVTLARTENNDYESSQKPEQSLSKLCNECPLTVLVVEDNEVNQLVIKSYLEKLSYYPRIVSSGKEAIDILDQGHIDVILMDCFLDDMDGVTLTKKIRKKYSKPFQPFVAAVTANSDQDFKTECLNAGMNYFMSKPIRNEDLIDALKKGHHYRQKQK